MAIIIDGHTQCPLCDGVLGANDDTVSTTAFIGDSADPLWRFSDAGMHRACFLGWNDRESFVDRFNATVGQVVWGDGSRHRMAADGSINVDRAKDEQAG